MASWDETDDCFGYPMNQLTMKENNLSLAEERHYQLILQLQCRHTVRLMSDASQALYHLIFTVCSTFSYYISAFV